MLKYKPTMQELIILIGKFMAENLTFSKLTISTQNANVI